VRSLLATKLQRSLKVKDVTDEVSELTLWYRSMKWLHYKKKKVQSNSQLAVSLWEACHVFVIMTVINTNSSPFLITTKVKRQCAPLSRNAYSIFKLFCKWLRGWDAIMICWSPQNNGDLPPPRQVLRVWSLYLTSGRSFVSCHLPWSIANQELKVRGKK
jgi:hypothetical protein